MMKSLIPEQCYFSTICFERDVCVYTVKEAKFTEEDVKTLSHRIQFGGDEVVQAKDGAGSATLSMVSGWVL